MIQYIKHNIISLGKNRRDCRRIY